MSSSTKYYNFNNNDNNNNKTNNNNNKTNNNNETNNNNHNKANNIYYIYTTVNFSESNRRAEENYRNPDYHKFHTRDICKYQTNLNDYAIFFHDSYNTFEDNV